MRRISFFIISILVFSLFTACVDSGKKKEEAQTDTYQNIKPADAKKRMDSEKGIVLLDVRTPEEYEDKHIPGSTLIPVEVIEKQAPGKLTDKNATLFVYCRSGRRSVAASEALVKMGYKNVYNLGGIQDWPYETERGAYKK